MTKREREKDVLAEVFDKKPKVKASQEAREKSFRAFQDGLKDSRSAYKKEKRLKLRKHLIGLTSTIAAAGIITVLSFGLFDGASPEDTRNQGNEDNQTHETATTNIDPQEVSDILNDMLNRQPRGIEESSSFQTVGFSNLDLKTYVPADWKIEEMEGDEDKYTLRLSGPAGEEMTLHLFKQNDPDVFHHHVQEVTAKHAHAEKIPIQTERFVEALKTNRFVDSNFEEDIFPFDIEHTEMAAFVDKENGTYSDFITSELFGYPMVFTSELPLDDVDSWDFPIHFFTEIHTTEGLVVRGSEGKDHPEYNRPIEKTVILPIGATFAPDFVQMELYENDELQLTSYLPADTEVERIEHEYFTEWRFINPSISKNSFYSFGKLKDGFPLENGEEIMFDAFGIDPAFSPPDMPGIHGDPHHYSYGSANADTDSDINISGGIDLYEINGDWYYTHRHDDFQDYNGGYLFARLQYFIDSIEWH